MGKRIAFLILSLTLIISLLPTQAVMAEETVQAVYGGECPKCKKGKIVAEYVDNNCHKLFCDACYVTFDWNARHTGVIECGETGKCSVCGGEYTLHHEVADLISSSKKSCSFRCSNCEKIIKVDGHEGVPCEGTGTCMYCGTEVKNKGHNFTQEWGASDPTCDKPGNRWYAYCSNCHLYIGDYNKPKNVYNTKSASSDPFMISPKGHTWGTEYTVDIEPTCKKEGSESIHCTVCGAINEETVRSVAKNKDKHTYGDWEEETPVSCETPGKYKRVCTGCGDTETREISATGHRWQEEYTVDKVATCTEEGSESKHCAVCGAIREGTSRTIEKKAHEYGEWKEEPPASCEDPGTKKKVCSGCGDTVTEVIPATGHSWSDPVIDIRDGGADITFTCSNPGEEHKKTVEASVDDQKLDTPTDKKDGKCTYTVTYTLDGKEITRDIEVEIPRAGEGITYSCEAGSASWFRGSGKDIVLRFVRSAQDEFTFELFSTLYTDGKETPAGSYSSAPGSVVITLGADYLETLEDGEHTFTAEFTDAGAQAVLTVSTQAPEEDTVPGTGVEDHAGLYAGLTVISVISLAAVLYWKKRICC